MKRLKVQRGSTFLFLTLLVVSFAGARASVASAAVDTDRCSKAFGKVEIISADSQSVVLEKLSESEREVVGRYGPFGRPLAIMKRDGRAVVYGMLAAVERSKVTVDQHRDLVLSLSGALSSRNLHGVQVSAHPALAGSAVISDDFVDLDIDTVVLTQEPDFREADFHNPTSKSVRALAQFIQGYVREIIQEGRAAFSDFKAGEYNQVPNDPRAQETRSRSIKWTLDELLAGEKTVIEADGTSRNMTLEEAIASESRVKIDWIVEGDAPPSIRELMGIERRFYDVTVVFRFAGKRGSGPPIMRIAREDYVPEEGATGGYVAMKGTVGILPIRITTALFRLEDLDILSRVAAIAPGVELENLNRLTLGIARTYWRQGHPHKVLRRLLMRLYFWNDGYVFAQRVGSSGVTGAMIQEEIRSILESRHLSAIRILEGIAEQAIAAGEVGLSHEEIANRTLVAARDYFKNHFPEKATPTTLSEVVDLSKELVEELVREQLSERRLVQKYIDFALNEMNEQAIEAPEARKIFAAFSPVSSFVNSYRRRLRGNPRQGHEGWVERYPEIKFSHPSDLHLTIAMLGENSESSNQVFRAEFENLQEKIREIPIELRDGKLEIIGRSGSQIAVVFDESQIPMEVWAAIQDFKTAIVRNGLSPDSRHGLSFVPHISLAYIRDAYRSAEGKRSIIRFFDENSLTPRMRNTHLQPQIKLLEVLEMPDTEMERRYRNAR